MPETLASSVETASDDGDGTWWEEEDEDEEDNSGRISTPSSSEQPLMRAKPGKDSNDDASTNDGGDEEHPLRTDEWELDVRVPRWCPPSEADWFPETTTATNRKSGRRRRQVVRFAVNGFVLVVEDESGDGDSTPPTMQKIGDDDSAVPTVQPRRRKNPRVGKWRIGHGGVCIDIPATLTNTKPGGTDGVKRTVLHYRADIHLNKFGERPRMFRGVITRDRHSSIFPANFLRPVVGTFSAEGIGKDTADTSYKDRGFGLARQQQ